MVEAGVDYFSIQSATGITPYTSIENFLVYPNPTSGNLTLEMNGDFAFTLLNTLGQEVLNGKGLDIKQVDISNFQAGAYILKISNDSTVYMMSIVKK